MGSDDDVNADAVPTPTRDTAATISWLSLVGEAFKIAANFLLALVVIAAIVGLPILACSACVYGVSSAWSAGVGADG